MAKVIEVSEFIFSQLPNTQIAFHDRIIDYMESVIEQEKDFNIRQNLRQDVKIEREEKLLLIKQMYN